MSASYDYECASYVYKQSANCLDQFDEMFVVWWSSWSGLIWLTLLFGVDSIALSLHHVMYEHNYTICLLHITVQPSQILQLTWKSLRSMGWGTWLSATDVNIAKTSLMKFLLCDAHLCPDWSDAPYHLELTALLSLCNMRCMNTTVQYIYFISPMRTLLEPVW